MYSDNIVSYSNGEEIRLLYCRKHKEYYSQNCSNCMADDVQAEWEGKVAAAIADRDAEIIKWVEQRRYNKKGGWLFVDAIIEYISKPTTCRDCKTWDECGGSNQEDCVHQATGRHPRDTTPALEARISEVK